MAIFVVYVIWSNALSLILVILGLFLPFAKPDNM
jgi:hypothetical protein